MSYEEVMAAIREELDAISEQCEEEGYPSHGSNYELRAAETWKWYEEQYPEYFGS